MTRKDIIKIKETLSVLIGEPLRELDRSGPMLIFNFGELVEVDDLKIGDDKKPIIDDDGRGVPIKSLVGKYALDALCSMRFTCGNEVIFAKSDIFLPTEEQFHKEGFVWDTFDWHTYGNTIFDELVSKHFKGEFSKYIVKNVKIDKFGDLTITFDNNFTLEFFADGSEYSENWRFGESDNSDSLIVTSKGIIDESMQI